MSSTWLFFKVPNPIILLPPEHLKLKYHVPKKLPHYSFLYKPVLPYMFSIFIKVSQSFWSTRFEILALSSLFQFYCFLHHSNRHFNHIKCTLIMSQSCPLFSIFTLTVMVLSNSYWLYCNDLLHIFLVLISAFYYPHLDPRYISLKHNSYYTTYSQRMSMAFGKLSESLSPINKTFHGIVAV